jgi:hypothetical protein
MVAIRAGAREVPVLKPADVRFGSKADIRSDKSHVRFTPKSGHQTDIPQCPLSADTVAKRFLSLERRTFFPDLI